MPLLCVQECLQEMCQLLLLHAIQVVHRLQHRLVAVALILLEAVRILLHLLVAAVHTLLHLLREAVVRILLQRQPEVAVVAHTLHLRLLAAQ